LLIFFAPRGPLPSLQREEGCLRRRHRSTSVPRRRLDQWSARAGPASDIHVICTSVGDCRRCCFATWRGESCHSGWQCHQWRSESTRRSSVQVFKCRTESLPVWHSAGCQWVHCWESRCQWQRLKKEAFRVLCCLVESPVPVPLPVVGCQWASKAPQAGLQHIDSRMTQRRDCQSW